ncbi:MAG: uncharacterized protein QOD75_2688 [Blastocatellia bacterium]|jgi:uncharacterized membrane protein (UPF0182 family)|nr:uncharacterized protein [Blastocatellia bacterium]
MSNSTPLDRDDRVIDIGSPDRPRRRRWKRWVLAAIVLVLMAGGRSLSIYLSALWFGSLGYAPVYWYIFRLKLVLFVVFAILTAAILRGGFWLLERTFRSYALERRTIVVNNQPVSITPGRFMKPIGWAVALLCGVLFGLDMRANWRAFALYANQVATSAVDPIFQKPLGFYLFSFPVHQLISWWLLLLAFVLLCAAILYAVLTNVDRTDTGSVRNQARTISITAVSFPLAAFLLCLAWRFFLSRYPYLWEDHQTFSGVNYTEAHFLLPGIMFVTAALIVAAIIVTLNAVTKRRLRLVLLALALPLAVYLVAVIIIPGYVTNFIVKPNELGRETPYIEHNIQATRKAFAIESIELREFEAENSVQALALADNRPTLDNIRLWDWRALQDTLKQTQAIRTYYDFPDVDVDRYRINGQSRQMMIAGREMDTRKLPESSRNWINEKLIYTHGYGATMNTSNGFTPEGMPQFVLSNMPLQSTSAEIKVDRPQIYYGQETDTDVYVKTKQKEFDFPQGEANTYTSYEGTGGIQVGSGLRRMLLAWALGDLSKLPFSDDVTSDSRVLIHRNIREIVNGLAPFLIYDDDPYLVTAADGHLYWMMDAFTESENYPYSRHHRIGGNSVNYVRNSVKVVIDAYNGTTRFYVFDSQDPLIATYRAMFPSLFQDAAQMPAELRAHVRYPETLIKVQGEVYGLYHTQSSKVFFQREDVWSIAQQVGIDDQNKKLGAPIDPYFVLMQLPGEPAGNEFVIILPFTPANRNNMIGWMAGRCDGENYGKLLVYNFPKSRLIDGPLQIEARIDQNAQLSAQFSLWNQQGSRVLRGHLLVIPVGRSLLYVEPVYLQAERSPMPELRLVVLATQERLGYGQTFDEAMTSLFGDAGTKPSEVKPGEGKLEPAKPNEPGVKPSPTPIAAPTPVQNTQQLIERALREFDEYQRLTAQGKLGEAGQKLDQCRRTLEELRRTSATTPRP